MSVNLHRIDKNPNFFVMKFLFVRLSEKEMFNLNLKQ